LNNMNNMLDFGRESACYAIGYYVQRYGLNDLKTDECLQDLRAILQKQDKKLRASAIFAYNSIVKKSEDKSIEGLENEL
jgi:hypothetical protein